MGMMAVSMADTRLIQHLNSGGQIGDDVARAHIEEIVSNTMAHPQSGGAVRRGASLGAISWRSTSLQPRRSCQTL